MRQNIPTEIWVLLVRRADIPYLNRSLAGLNLIERHIREAQHWNIRQIIFWLEPPQMQHDQALRIEFERLMRRLRTKYDHHFVKVISRIDELTVHEAEKATAAPHLCLFSYQWISRWSLSLLPLYQQRSTFEQVWNEVRLLPEMDEWKVSKNATVFYIPILREKDWGWAQKRLGVEIVEQSRSGIVGKNFNRRISLFLSRFLVQFEASPKVWTWVNVVFGLIAAALVMQPSYTARLWGVLVFYWSCIFDGVDGEVARFRFETSEQGALLDMAASWFNTLLFYGSVVLSLVSTGELSVSSGQFLLIGSSALLVLLSAYFINFVKVPMGQGAWSEWERKNSKVLRVPWLTLFYRKEAFAGISVLLVALNQMTVLAWCVVVALFVSVGIIADLEWRTRRVLAKSDLSA